MDPLDHIITKLALTMGVAWAGGINLYATLLVLGILGRTGNLVLPVDLQVLTQPVVIAAAGFMYIVEFFADKIPGVDTAWDTLHTFIRIPAAALLAAAAVGHITPALMVAAALVGGALGTTSHAAKSGARVLINTSPEPFTNWTASILEDLIVVAGLWTALHHPWVFVCLLIVFIMLSIWLLPKLWRGIKKVFGFIGRGLRTEKVDGRFVEESRRQKSE